MKKYTIKNYKGNLVESLMKFSEKYKGMRIIEAVEDGKMLKIKADLKENETDLTEDAADSYKKAAQAAEKSPDGIKTTMWFADEDDNIPIKEKMAEAKKYRVWFFRDKENDEYIGYQGVKYIVIAQDKKHFEKWFRERYLAAGDTWSEEEIQDALSEYI